MMNTSIQHQTAHVAPVPRISLNADDAAKALGLSKRQLFAIKDAGELPFIQTGSTFLFDPADLAAWREKQKKVLSPSDIAARIEQNRERVRKKKSTKGGTNNGEHLN